MLQTKHHRLSLQVQGRLTSSPEDLTQGEEIQRVQPSESLCTSTLGYVCSSQSLLPSTPTCTVFPGPVCRFYLPFTCWMSCELQETGLLSDSSPWGKSVLVSGC